ncbi:MAG: serine/threonine-protein phosphatase [Caulobacteraceae bacterium]|nr:serine/threonine-protein phosphatase [Caulobacter sp.]
MSTPGRLAFTSAARTHVGKVRKLNEDALCDRPELGLWAVADGMGGHQAGDVASGLIVEALAGVDDVSSGFALLEDVRRSIQRVNRTLIARAAVMAPGALIGSTVVSLVVYEDFYACLWAGDSRAYLLRDGRMEQVTRDHSRMQELIDSGSLSRLEARSYARSNVITRAVGVSDRLALDMQQGPLQVDDLFLLCSDGLTGALDDRTIAAILNQPSLETAADMLIARTLDQGARDNVTVVLVRCEAAADDTLDQHRSPLSR